MLEFFIAKLLAACLLTGCSILGYALPIVVFAFAAQQQLSVHHHPSPISQRSGWLISLATCFSAGVLLWAAASHFLLESVESFESSEGGMVHQHTTSGEPHMHIHDHGADAHKSVHLSSVRNASIASLFGLLLPLLVEKVLQSMHPGGKTSHGHSHAMSDHEDQHESFVVHPPPQPTSSSSSVGVPSPPTVGVASSSSTTVVAVVSTSVKASLQSSVTAAAAGATPAIGVPSTSLGGAPPTPLAAVSHSQASATFVLSRTAAVLVLLMSLHNSLEGAAIGFTIRRSSLRRSVAPLLIHKILDGVVVGVSEVRRIERESNSQQQQLQQPHRGGSSISSVCGLVWHWATRTTTLIWTFSLPVVCIICSMISTGDADVLVSTSTAGAFLPPPGGMDGVPIVEGNPTTGGDWNAPASATLPAIVLAVTSGSFVYVGLCGMLKDELLSSPPPPSRMGLHSHSPTYDFLAKLGALAFGMLTGWIVT